MKITPYIKIRQRLDLIKIYIKKEEIVKWKERKKERKKAQNRRKGIWLKWNKKAKKESSNNELKYG